MRVRREAARALDWLDAAAALREAAGVRRVLAPRASQGAAIDLASNDYLGLSRHPEVIDGVKAALDAWGAGATGSRLVTGTTAAHEELEEELARFSGQESALVFSSGYLANIGAVAALSGRGALVGRVPFGAGRLDPEAFRRGASGWFSAGWVPAS